MKRKHIDFIIYEDVDERLVFRFYPRKSKCHSFNDEPPHCWKEVYKVYYAYSVFKIYKYDNIVKFLFGCDCDECSVIDEIAAIIPLICEGKTKIAHPVLTTERYVEIELLDREVFPIGDGVSWIIRNVKQSGNYEIIMWKYNDVGYRFYLDKTKLKDFGLYLQKCCEYMLKHGEPI